MTVGEAIRAAADRLAAVSDTARLDAELLMAHLFGASRSELLLRHMRDPVPPGFAALIERRNAHEPVAYITGRQEFYGLPLHVTPATLIPRGDSETLVEAALAARPDARRVLDLGTGSGALLLAVLAYLREAQGVGIDRSPAALAVAAGNAEQLGLRPQASFTPGDWHAPGWAETLGTFDLILCNPPYVEETAALDRQVRDHEPAIDEDEAAVLSASLRIGDLARQLAHGDGGDHAAHDHDDGRLDFSRHHFMHFVHQWERIKGIQHI